MVKQIMTRKVIHICQQHLRTSNEKKKEKNKNVWGPVGKLCPWLVDEFSLPALINGPFGWICF